MTMLSLCYMPFTSPGGLTRETRLFLDVNSAGNVKLANGTAAPPQWRELPRVAYIAPVAPSTTTTTTETAAQNGTVASTSTTTTTTLGFSSHPAYQHCTILDSTAPVWRDAKTNLQHVRSPDLAVFQFTVPAGLIVNHAAKLVFLLSKAANPQEATIQ